VRKGERTDSGADTIFRRYREKLRVKGGKSEGDSDELGGRERKTQGVVIHIRGTSGRAQFRGGRAQAIHI